MSLEWDGFRLSLARDGLEFLWVGGGVLEVRVSHCASASLHPPTKERESHRLDFRFRFPAGAAGTDPAVVRLDVPPGQVEQARRFLRVLWDDYSVPDRPEDEAGSGPGAGAGSGTGTGAGSRAGSGSRPVALALALAEPVTEAAPEENPDTAPGTAPNTAAEAAPSKAEPETEPEPELGRVPEGPAWIVNHVGPRSDELFRDVMARPANSDH
ncbi:hypothetical protein [Streptomyces sp. NPDC056169]|uniref:hypothetical protein n=1 Tax=Streptomyces sp. NPDC056169 TaxID=3345734 RepID=UPI0035DE4F43